jgi:hypothetical protein
VVIEGVGAVLVSADGTGPDACADDCEIHPEEIIPHTIRIIINPNPRYRFMVITPEPKNREKSRF